MDGQFAEKSEKKALKILINKLKTIRDFESLENNLQRTTNNSMQDNSKIHQNLATNSINNHSDGSSINPETKKPWDDAEVKETIALKELKANALTDRKVEALVAFMKLLTDKKYEHLLEK